MITQRIRELLDSNRVLLHRAGWFFAGAFVNYGVNAGLYATLHYRLGLSHYVAYLASLACAMAALFVWNYTVNFRTGRSWQGALSRYLLVQAGTFLVNYSIVAALHHFQIGVWWLNIFFAQCAPALLKFLLYHKWVFPHHQDNEDA